jgi:outer membrane lipoprotein-sorting protein
MPSIHKVLLFSLVVALVTVSCKKAHDEDHEDVAGFQIFLNNSVVASQSGTNVTGTITLTQGTTTSAMRVEFRDPDGDVMIISDDDDYLQVDSSNNNVVTSQLDASSDWSFTLTGVSAGQANITIKLMHGDHADFESRPIPVVVSAAQ